MPAIARRRRSIFKSNGRRRRGSRWETRTVIQCRTTKEIYSDDLTCTANQSQEAILLIAPNMLDSPVNPFPLISPSGRGVTVGGIKFQADHFFDPAAVQGNPSSCDPSPLDTAFILSIWEAIVYLPLTEGFGQGGAAPIPAYLPNLVSPTFQGNDDADRVLWKRLTHIPWWGLNVGNGVFPQLVSTQSARPEGTIVAVRSRAWLDDKHGLYYVRQFVHDLSLAPGPNCNIPLFLDAWFKVFYKARR